MLKSEKRNINHCFLACFYIPACLHGDNIQPLGASRPLRGALKMRHKGANNGTENGMETALCKSLTASCLQKPSVWHS